MSVLGQDSCKQWHSKPQVTGLYFSRNFKPDATQIKPGWDFPALAAEEESSVNTLRLLWGLLDFCCLSSGGGGFKVTWRGHSCGLFLLTDFKWIKSCPEVTALHKQHSSGCGGVAGGFRRGCYLSLLFTAGSLKAPKIFCNWIKCNSSYKINSFSFLSEFQEQHAIRWVSPNSLEYIFIWYCSI